MAVEWPDDMPIWEVPRIWPGSTIVVAGSGPSLIAEDLLVAREYARVIVVNSSYKLLPNADVLYACDYWWWRHYNIAPDFLGVRVGLGWKADTAQPYTGYVDDYLEGKVHLIASNGDDGLEIDDPRAIRTGANSGYQAINLAVHLGAERIVLLGFDMKDRGGRMHWHEDHPGRPDPPFQTFLPHFETMVEPLKEAGIEVLNATPDSALETFPKVDLMEAIV